MTMDEFGREEGVDYSGQAWTVAGDTYSVQTDEIEDHTTDIKVFRYVVRDLHGSRKTPPLDLNYDTGLSRRLYKNQSFNHGELYRTEYYAQTANGSDGWPTYSDLVLREDVSYTRDSLGFAHERTTIITWYLEDGSAHATTKSLHKTYSVMEAQQEGQTRRGNIVSQLSAQVAGMLVATVATSEATPDVQSKIELGRVFMQSHKIATDMFVAAAKKDIVAEVKYSTESWLANVVAQNGTTIRDVILSAVDIWGIRDSV